MGFMSSLAQGLLFYAFCGAGAAGQNAPAVRLLSDRHCSRWLLRLQGRAWDHDTTSTGWLFVTLALVAE